MERGVHTSWSQRRASAALERAWPRPKFELGDAEQSTLRSGRFRVFDSRRSSVEIQRGRRFSRGD
jgi:hypothetical protein